MEFEKAIHISKLIRAYMAALAVHWYSQDPSNSLDAIEPGLQILNTWNEKHPGLIARTSDAVIRVISDELFIAPNESQTSRCASVLIACSSVIQIQTDLDKGSIIPDELWDKFAKSLDVAGFTLDVAGKLADVIGKVALILALEAYNADE